jgi:hypothetical protein
VIQHAFQRTCEYFRRKKNYLNFFFPLLLKLYFIFSFFALQLQENTSNRDLDWNDFSEVELERFLDVLKDEEELCVQQVQK